eukprot:366369-Chlamydomonas_euryale.AAC.3
MRSCEGLGRGRRLGRVGDGAHRAYDVHRIQCIGFSAGVGRGYIDGQDRHVCKVHVVREGAEDEGPAAALKSLIPRPRSEGSGQAEPCCANMHTIPGLSPCGIGRGCCVSQVRNS